MFPHLISHIITHEVMQQSGRAKVTGPIYGDPQIKSFALILLRAATALLCAGLLACWVLVWIAEAARYTAAMAALSVAACALAALNLLWALTGSGWLKKLGWTSSLLQFAAGILLLSWLGMNRAPDDWLKLFRVGLVAVPVFKVFVTGLFLYDRRPGGKIPVDQFPE